MTRTGFEPVLPPWKGGVLTTWPTGRGSEGRIRTYDRSVNSRLLYHWATSEYEFIIGPTNFIASTYLNDRSFKLERVMRIELTTSAWKAEVLPLNYTRNIGLKTQKIWALVDFLPTNLFIKLMAVPTGIEPAISCVTGRHVNRYTTGPFVSESVFELIVMSRTIYQTSSTLNNKSTLNI